MEEYTYIWCFNIKPIAPPVDTLFWTKPLGSRSVSPMQERKRELGTTVAKYKDGVYGPSLLKHKHANTCVTYADVPASRIGS